MSSIDTTLRNKCLHENICEPRERCFPKAMSHKTFHHKSYSSPNSKHGSSKLFVEEVRKCTCREQSCLVLCLHFKNLKTLKTSGRLLLHIKYSFISYNIGSQHFLPW